LTGIGPEKSWEECDNEFNLSIGEFPLEVVVQVDTRILAKLPKPDTARTHDLIMEAQALRTTCKGKNPKQTSVDMDGYLE
jgi:hypothetical protein